MEYLGDVETVTSDGKLVIRAVSAPDVNNAVFDEREQRIGTVKRVFGPVDSLRDSCTGHQGGPERPA